jgi:hypothetical protein
MAAGRGQKGGGVVSHAAAHPRPFVYPARVREQDAGGRGLCRVDPRSRAWRAPFALKRGRGQRGCGGGSHARCPVRVSGGRGQRRGVAYLSRAALRSPFAHMGGVPRPPRAERGGNRAPRPAHVAYRAGRQQGAHRRGPLGKRGRGHANCVCMPPPPLHHPVRVRVARKGGRALTVGGRGRRGGKRE